MPGQLYFRPALNPVPQTGQEHQSISRLSRRICVSVN